MIGVKDFAGDKTQDGGFNLDIGKPVTFRYRVVIHPGDTNSANLAPLFQQYTAKVK